MEATMPPKIFDNDKKIGDAMATGIGMGMHEPSPSPIVQSADQPVEISTEGKTLPEFPPSAQLPKETGIVGWFKNLMSARQQ